MIQSISKQVAKNYAFLVYSKTLSTTEIGGFFNAGAI